MKVLTGKEMEYSAKLCQGVQWPGLDALQTESCCHQSLFLVGPVTYATTT